MSYAHRGCVHAPGSTLPFSMHPCGPLHAPSCWAGLGWAGLQVKKAASSGLMSCVAAVRAEAALTVLRHALPRERRMHLAAPQASGQRMVAMLEAIKSCFERCACEPGCCLGP